MSSPDRHTDGNAIAGLLQEILVPEMTAAIRACQSCRAHNPIGEHRLYEGAGLVLRCPHCGDLAACIGTHAGGHAVTLHGTWLLPSSP
jgi:hypothetical protein